MKQLFFIVNHVKLQFTQVCLRVKIYRMKQEKEGNNCRLLGSIQRHVSYQANALTCAADVYMFNYLRL